MPQFSQNTVHGVMPQFSQNTVSGVMPQFSRNNLPGVMPPVLSEHGTWCYAPFLSKHCTWCDALVLSEQLTWCDAPFLSKHCIWCDALVFSEQLTGVMPQFSQNTLLSKETFTSNICTSSPVRGRGMAGLISLFLSRRPGSVSPCFFFFLSPCGSWKDVSFAMEPNRCKTARGDIQ